MSQEQISKDLISLHVSSCLSVWSRYVHLLFCTKSLIPSSKFQVPVSRGPDAMVVLFVSALIVVVAAASAAPVLNDTDIRGYNLANAPGVTVCC